MRSFFFNYCARYTKQARLKTTNNCYTLEFLFSITERKLRLIVAGLHAVLSSILSYQYHIYFVNRITPGEKLIIIGATTAAVNTTINRHCSFIYYSDFNATINHYCNIRRKGFSDSPQPLYLFIHLFLGAGEFNRISQFVRTVSQHRRFFPFTIRYTDRYRKIHHLP